jgi:hypothetical protein
MLNRLLQRFLAVMPAKAGLPAMPVKAGMTRGGGNDEGLNMRLVKTKDREEI